MRNSSRFARDYHAKLPGKNSCNLQAKTLESQVKLPAKRRQNKKQTQAKTPTQSQAELPKIAQKKNLQVLAICYYTAGKFTCILQVS